MLRIAITGGIACGKSLVGSILSEEGVAICEADEIAHELLNPGSIIFKRVIEEFGRDILSKEGTIDSRALGSIVFSDFESLQKLNELVHPGVKDAWDMWLVTRTTDCHIAAVIVPLLFESANGSGWDAVICVAAPETAQRARLADRGLSDAEMTARIETQMPIEEKMIESDFVVFNRGTVDSVREQVARIMSVVNE